jgi:hypothetical protein
MDADYAKVNQPAQAYISIPISTCAGHIIFVAADDLPVQQTHDSESDDEEDQEERMYRRRPGARFIDDAAAEGNEDEDEDESQPPDAEISSHSL